MATLSTSDNFLDVVWPMETLIVSGSNLDREKVYQWIIELSAPETREGALLELSKKREAVPDLAPMLWHSFGTMAALLQVVHT